MKRRKPPLDDWGELAVLILSLITYVPWAVILGVGLAGLIMRFNLWQTAQTVNIFVSDEGKSNAQL